MAAELDGNAIEALLKVNRGVLIDFDGIKEKIACYACNRCKTIYVIEDKSHNYCPFCGIKHSIIVNALVDT